jgi:hypothetical protein
MGTWWEHIENNKIQKNPTAPTLPQKNKKIEHNAWIWQSRIS